MTLPAARQEIWDMVQEASAQGARRSNACAVIGLSARTLQRWQKDRSHVDGRVARVQQPASQLTELERRRILTISSSPEFGQLPPSQIVPRLADQGIYVASESSFYRVLRAENQVRHRHAARPRQERSKPRALCATAPNQLYSWDITYLPTRVVGLHYYLYLFLDLYSRKVVGWQIYEDESSELAAEVMRDICRREEIMPGQVVLHSDNGSPMKGATMLATLQSLGVMPSFSRPAVSNDNPYSESMFKTLKYRPDYPSLAFDSLSCAREWVNSFVRWYNHEHRHSAIQFVTPAQRHAGQDEALLQARTAVYTAAKARNPERWSSDVRNWTPVTTVHLNPEQQAVKKPALRSIRQQDRVAA
jgi:transposase InsO family protein